MSTPHTDTSDLGGRSRNTVDPYRSSMTNFVKSDLSSGNFDSVLSQRSGDVEVKIDFNIDEDPNDVDATLFGPSRTPAIPPEVQVNRSSFKEYSSGDDKESSVEPVSPPRSEKVESSSDPTDDDAQPSTEDDQSTPDEPETGGLWDKILVDFADEDVLSALVDFRDACSQAHGYDEVLDDVKKLGRRQGVPFIQQCRDNSDQESIIAWSRRITDFVHTSFDATDVAYVFWRQQCQRWGLVESLDILVKSALEKKSAEPSDQQEPLDQHPASETKTSPEPPTTTEDEGLDAQKSRSRKSYIRSNPPKSTLNANVHHDLASGRISTTPNISVEDKDVAKFLCEQCGVDNLESINNNQLISLLSEKNHSVRMGHLVEHPSSRLFEQTADEWLSPIPAKKPQHLLSVTDSVSSSRHDFLEVFDDSDDEDASTKPAYIGIVDVNPPNKDVDDVNFVYSEVTQDDSGWIRAPRTSFHSDDKQTQIKNFPKVLMEYLFGILRVYMPESDLEGISATSILTAFIFGSCGSLDPDFFDSSLWKLDRRTYVCAKVFNFVLRGQGGLDEGFIQSMAVDVSETKRKLDNLVGKIDNTRSLVESHYMLGFIHLLYEAGVNQESIMNAEGLLSDSIARYDRIIVKDSRTIDDLRKRISLNNGRPKR